MELTHLYISSGHNYFGHHGQAPGHHAMIAVQEVRCCAARGIEGDRFFDHQENYKGQITFFAQEVYETLREQFQVWDKSLAVFRRNVITRQVNLNALIGVEFEIQGVRFLGVEECKACHWMEHAFHPGAETALAGRGGLRARILTDGILRVTRGTDSAASTVNSRALAATT